MSMNNIQTDRQKLKAVFDILRKVYHYSSRIGVSKNEVVRMKQINQNGGIAWIAPKFMSYEDTLVHGASQWDSETDALIGTLLINFHSFSKRQAERLGDVIVQELAEFGFTVSWNGNIDEAIEVSK